MIKKPNKQIILPSITLDIFLYGSFSPQIPKLAYNWKQQYYIKVLGFQLVDH